MAVPTYEEFYRLAIKELRENNPVKGGRKSPGIHVVYSGFNNAFKQAYGIDARPITDELVKNGKIALRLVRGGAMIYLPEDVNQYERQAPIDSQITAADILSKIKNKQSSVKDMRASGLAQALSAASAARSIPAPIDNHVPDEPQMYNLSKGQSAIHQLLLINKVDPDYARYQSLSEERKKKGRKLAIKRKIKKVVKKAKKCKCGK